jgi:hypothetical protein
MINFKRVCAYKSVHTAKLKSFKLRQRE